MGMVSRCGYNGQSNLMKWRVSMFITGTHVAGTIGGKTVGVANDVTLLDIKALDCEGESTTGAILEGMMSNEQVTAYCVDK